MANYNPASPIITNNNTRVIEWFEPPIVLPFAVGVVMSPKNGTDIPPSDIVNPHCRRPTIAHRMIHNQNALLGREKPKRGNDDQQGEVAPVPIRHDVKKIMDDIIAPNARESSRDIFWKFVARLNWVGRITGDREMSKNTVRNHIDGESQSLLREQYIICFNAMYETFTAMGVFDMCGVTTAHMKSTIVSHIIALGQDTYENLLVDTELVQMLVLMDDCQSAHEQFSALRRH